MLESDSLGLIPGPPVGFRENILNQHGTRAVPRRVQHSTGAENTDPGDPGARLPGSDANSATSTGLLSLPPAKWGQSPNPHHGLVLKIK